MYCYTARYVLPCFLFSPPPPPPRPTLFPYTTLFRSRARPPCVGRRQHDLAAELVVHVPRELARGRRLARAVDAHHQHHRRNRARSEEHTSELQSQSNLVCRLLLEKKKKNKLVTQLHV